MIFNVNGVLKDVSDTTDALSRAVIISLFTWRRAETDDDTERAYGWWGDSYPVVANDRIGSRLWLLCRSKLTNNTAAKARDYIRQALEWMTEDGVAARIDIDATRTGLTSLKVSIVIWQRDGSKHALIFDEIWQGVLNNG